MKRYLWSVGALSKRSECVCVLMLSKLVRFGVVKTDVGDFRCVFDVR